MYRSSPFDPAIVPKDLLSKDFVEVTLQDRIYGILVAYIPNHISDGVQLHSFRPPRHSSKMDKGEESEEKDCALENMTLGYGLVSFQDNKGLTMYALHQSVGDPVGSSCGAVQKETLILFGDKSEISAFFQHLIEIEERTKKGSFKIMKWIPRHLYWCMKGICKARSLESVILPEEIKDLLMKDIHSFLSPSAKEFYSSHGIPYKRSYLFYGIPGTGKTSLIQALAGHLKRNICYMHLTNPEMTDDSLQDAMSTLPKESIVVFEDIDALFAHNRSNKISTSPLTFSGLLNALDGVGSCHGHIFILTTNIREDLDPALIRSGRVDLHIPFDNANKEQMRKIWQSYYPQAAPELADTFADGVHSRLESLSVKIAASQLQHFFVVNRLNTAEKALENLSVVTDDIQSRVLDPTNDKKMTTSDTVEKVNIHSLEHNAANNIKASALVGAVAYFTAYTVDIILQKHVKRSNDIIPPLAGVVAGICMYLHSKSRSSANSFHGGPNPQHQLVGYVAY
jgi:chaperone BCS1